MTNPNVCCCCGEEHGLDDMHDVKIKGKNKKICKECAIKLVGANCYQPFKEPKIQLPCLYTNWKTPQKLNQYSHSVIYIYSHC